MRSVYSFRTVVSTRTGPTWVTLRWIIVATSRVAQGLAGIFILRRTARRRSARQALP